MRVEPVSEVSEAKEARSRGWLFITPLVLLWLVPLIAFVCLVPLAQASTNAAVSPPRIELVTVGSRTASNPQAVDLTVSLPPALSLRTNASGTVTAVDVHTGQSLTSGTPLIAVNDVEVLAFVASSPLYRDLTRGSTGADVERLSGYFASLGLLAPQNVSNTYGRALSLASSAFEKRIGATPDGQFHLSSIAFVPAGAAEVSTVSVQVGDQVGAGTSVAGVLGQPTSIRFVVTGSQSQPSTDNVPLSLSRPGAKVAFSSLRLSASERAQIFQFLVDGVADGSLTQSASASTPTFSGSVLADASPQKTAVVPSSSLYTSSTGMTCIFSIAGTKGAFTATRIPNPQLVSGELGEAGVPSILAGKRIVRDPLGLSEETRSHCG